MTLNESVILDVIGRYQDGPGDGKDALIGQFRRETENYIYHFPKMGYRRGPDECSDFYLDMLERLEPVMRAFPLEDARAGDLRFKTWFNVVLRNQFFNFLKRRNRSSLFEQSLDCVDTDSLAVLAMPEDGSDALDGLRQGLARLDTETRGLLILYYNPESLDAHTLLALSDLTGLSLAEILAVQKEMMIANQREIGQKRSVAEKVSVINRKLSELRYRLHKSGRDPSAGETGPVHSLVARIARWENTRARLVRSLDREDGAAFEAFRKLFRDHVQARRSLEQARKKLKWEMLNGPEGRMAEVAG